jgi:uncharacterized protein YggE
VTVEISTIGKTLDAATSTHRERVDRATAALRGMENTGLKIERSTFRLSQNQPPIHPNAPQPKPEYQAATTFELTLSKLDAVDSTVTAIAATGLFEVRNIRFGIGERDAGLNAARKAAIDDARERATTYAAAAGVQLGSIVKIEDGGSGGPPELFAAAPAARSVGITPPEALTLSASVTVTWRITDRP